MENKKIKNATTKELDGIKFKSQLEVTIYKTLVSNAITPEYEKRTFEFVPRLRPTVPFFNRVKKVFGLEMKPLHPITYTPDFTFEYDGMLIVIEAKGFENDVYPVKKNLFRRYLEDLPQYSMYFEIRTKKELLEALRIIKMETSKIRNIRKLIVSLPEKDIPVGNKLLEARNMTELNNLVSSVITKVEKSIDKGDNRYEDIDLAALFELQDLIMEQL